MKPNESQVYDVPHYWNKWGHSLLFIFHKYYCLSLYYLSPSPSISLYFLFSIPPPCRWYISSGCIWPNLALDTYLIRYPSCKNRWWYGKLYSCSKSDPIPFSLCYLYGIILSICEQLWYHLVSFTSLDIIILEIPGELQGILFLFLRFTSANYFSVKSILFGGLYMVTYTISIKMLIHFLRRFI